MRFAARRRRPGAGIAALCGALALVLFLASSIRHAVFQSAAFDLGIFDQGVYLLSQGQPPISSFMNFHLLGDHAAWIFYPISLLYRIVPSVHWLFLIQAASLASGAYWVWKLAGAEGLSPDRARLAVGGYCLFPTIFNINLADFHPEVMAVPLLLALAWAARARRPGWFLAALALCLGCRETMGLAVAGAGVWLMLCEGRRGYGVAALAAGGGWFLFAIWVVIPHYTLTDAAVEAADGRYAYLGSSVGGIIATIVAEPGVILGRIFSRDTLAYLALLAAPVWWGIRWRQLAPLLAASPILLLNILADYPPQRMLETHYSLPALPFVFVAVLRGLAAGGPWLKPRWALAWCVGVFLIAARAEYVIPATPPRHREAIAAALRLIPPGAAVLTTDYLAPHVTHRPRVYVLRPATLGQRRLLGLADYVCVDTLVPGWRIDRRVGDEFVAALEADPAFRLVAAQDGVYLFERIRRPADGAP